MLDEIFVQRRKRGIQDLNIVPILDMLTTVIFFLLLSTTFVQYTKHTIPPSRTVESASAAKEPPLLPKLVLTGDAGSTMNLTLTWGGADPGRLVRTLSGMQDDSRRVTVLKASRELATEFKKKHPAENTLQIGLGAALPFQDLISMMDGIGESLHDLILISPSNFGGTGP